MKSDLKIIESNKILQAKYLPILSQILLNIDKNTVSLQLLQKKLELWSLEKYKSSEIYKKHNGLITNNLNKPTTAFKYYINLLIELKLIVKQNDFVHCSKYGLVFVELYNELNNETNNNQEFNEYEKLFYLLIIFSYDSDLLLLIIDFLAKQTNDIAIAELSKQYNNLLKTRLEYKLKHNENPQTRDKYLSLLRKDKINTKNIFAVRLEWLLDFKIIEKVKNNTFKISEKGIKFYNFLEKTENGLSYIENQIFNTNMTEGFANLFDKKIKFKDINLNEQLIYLNKYLLKSYEKLNADSILRLSTLPTFIFVSITMFAKENIIINFTEIKNILVKGFEIENKNYSMHDASRINESYILINIK